MAYYAGYLGCSCSPQRPLTTLLQSLRHQHGVRSCSWSYMSFSLSLSFFIPPFPYLPVLLSYFFCFPLPLLLPLLLLVLLYFICSIFLFLHPPPKPCLASLCAATATRLHANEDSRVAYCTTRRWLRDLTSLQAFQASLRQSTNGTS